MTATKVPTNGAATSANINAIIDDIRDPTAGHDHDGSNGKRVDHADLVETGAMSGRTNTHTQIDSHIAASEAVHDLPSNFHVMGHKTNQKIVITGEFTFTVDQITNAGQEDSQFVGFGAGLFSAAPRVFLQRYSPDGTSGFKGFLWEVIKEVSADGFRVTVHADPADPVPSGGKDIYYYWMAIGNPA